MDKQKVKEALLELINTKQKSALYYTINHARYALAMISADAEEHDLKDQLLYVLNNMTHWRGETAERVRLTLKDAIMGA